MEYFRSLNTSYFHKSLLLDKTLAAPSSDDMCPIVFVLLQLQYTGRIFQHTHTIEFKTKELYEQARKSYMTYLCLPCGDLTNLTANRN